MADPLVRNLAGSLTAAALGLAVLGGALYAADGWLERKERAFRQAQASLARAARQYRNASDDQAVYQQYADRFRDMGRRGWIGEEQRLSWIEALQAINGELKLPVLRYDIGQRAQVPLTRVSFDASRLHLYRTPMTLEIGALHEYDVVRLLQQLATQGAGLMDLASCSFSQSGSIRFNPRAANIQASCALDWYTLQLDDAQDR